MNKKIAISTLLALTVSVVGGIASARSVSAVDGAPVIGASSGCFNLTPATGAVTSTCAASYLIPASIDTAGAKSIQFTSRATAAGAACRAVKNNRQGTAFVASPGVAIPVAGVPVIQATAAIPVATITDVLNLECATNAGTAIHAIFWTP